MIKRFWELIAKTAMYVAVLCPFMLCFGCFSEDAARYLHNLIIVFVCSSVVMVIGYALSD